MSRRPPDRRPPQVAVATTDNRPADHDRPGRVSRGRDAGRVARGDRGPGQGPAVRRGPNRGPATPDHGEIHE